ncbi:dipeptide ABC transporter ATP-binding protein [Paracoccus limosus]|uniref:Dipeptide ABC transporter ATP-binding protein n=1 Tax=Paracoccus limosus TaxID=913252 RepID=A0A844H766_9RHOB|nr:ABC transporter ATP-binding protein [Paracoccus limosus]MTH34168.1 dipeptide ABC transporter ATP-binding protein [Paracoccus limosus]
MSDGNLVSVRDLRVTFQTRAGEVQGLRGVGFDIAPGECLCVTGESGAGKSVSALALMRLVEFGGGRIRGGSLVFDGRDLARADPEAMRRIRGNRIGMVFQEPVAALNPVLSIGRQLCEGLIAHRGLSRAAAQAQALELLQQMRLPEPERQLRQYPHELSGGMCQRVVIAMAMACRPQLLICDEPTSALDVTTQAGILTLIDRLKQETGMAVLFISHDMAVVAQMADRILVLRRGLPVEEGPAARILAAPRHAYTRALLAAMPRLGAQADGPAPGPTGPPLLQVRGLVTRFALRRGLFRRSTGPQVHAVEDLSLDLARGETLALVGESGCGKTTAARSILRLIEPCAGSIRLDGREIMALDAGALREARRDMQMIFQDPQSSLDPRMSLARQVAEPLANYGIGTAAQRRDRVAALFDRVGLSRALMDRLPHELSGGQRQRVAIARALALEPRLIVADEPVSALDATVRAQVLDLLAGLQRDLGIALLFISHDMALVERISHRVAVMHQGRIVETGSRAQLFAAPAHSQTRRLLAAVPPLARGWRPPDDSGAPVGVIHPPGHAPAPVRWREVAPGHQVLDGPA